MKWPDGLGEQYETGIIRKRKHKAPPVNGGVNGGVNGSDSVGQHPPVQEGEGDRDWVGGLGKGKGREAAKKYFESARLLYPGNRNGLESEWDNFEKKNPEYDEILPLLIPAIEREIAHKAALKASNQFCAEWKNFQTWINKKCWTQEFGEVGAAPRRPAFGAPPASREQLERNMQIALGDMKGIAP
jgi:hypothetical protein